MLIDLMHLNHGRLNYVHYAVDSSKINFILIFNDFSDLHDNCCCVCHDFLHLTSVFTYSCDDFIVIVEA